MLEIIKMLSIDPFYGRLMKKLSTADLDIILSFCENSISLDRNEFEHRANRFFMDREKPKNWKIISEILSVINARRVI
jgi:hypothetical protein